MNPFFKFTIQFATNDRADFDLWLNFANELFTEGFTWYAVNGCWHGETETSYKLEILSENDITKGIEYFGRYIKNTYSQEAVMISVEKISVKFV